MFNLKFALNSTFRNSSKATFGTLAENGKQKWDIFAAVCLERKPIIIPQLNSLEKEFQEYLNDVEHRNSLKNDFELRNEAEIKQIEMLKSGDQDIELSLNKTAQDFLDASLEEVSKLKLASNVTDDDVNNNVKSLNRKLDKHLVLVINEKIGKDSYYVLPQAKCQDGESLRQVADRVLNQKVGGGLSAQIYGNAPVGFYKYKYPKQFRENVVGAKIFFYFARYLKGSISDRKMDYKWFDRNELSKALLPAYANSIKQFLIDE